jgi:hypothetical protein
VVNALDNTVVDCVRGLDNTSAQGHDDGAIVQDDWTAKDTVDLVAGLTKDHTEIGGHLTLHDANGNIWLGQTAVPSASNYAVLSNNIAAQAVILTTAGADEGIELYVSPKGEAATVFTGPINPQGGVTNQTVPGPALIGLSLFGVESAVLGTAPPALTGQFYMQAGTSVTITDSDGSSVIDFPVAFPNGVLMVLATQGDTTIGPIDGVSDYTTSSFNINYVGVGEVRTNWLAIGF